MMTIIFMIKRVDGNDDNDDLMIVMWDFVVVYICATISSFSLKQNPK